MKIVHLQNHLFKNAIFILKYSMMEENSLFFDRIFLDGGRR